jgi:ABC-type amino acid transport substrate-binding protein
MHDTTSGETRPSCGTALAALLASLVLLAGGCGATDPSPVAPRAPAVSALRVGVTPNAPPFAFIRSGELVGLEIDLARRLGAALGRPVRFVRLSWDAQLPALERGDIDVIMSGMSITVARQTRVAFADPYLRSGLAAMIRREDLDRYRTRADVIESTARIGFVADTTGEIYVRREVPRAQLAPYPDAASATTELTQRRIDIFVHDIPTVVSLVARNEGDLAVIRKRLDEEEIAWAFRPGDAELRTRTNAALALWRGDGTLQGVLDRWLPYWSRVE